MTNQPIVLGSSSPFRRAILEKLGQPFTICSPEIDETHQTDEAAEALVARLGLAKARAVAALHPNALIIASDQVAVLDGQILGKPGNHQNAQTQLRSASGKSVLFLTSLILLNAKTQTIQQDVIPFTVYFRHLNDSQINNYLHKETPYNCAGSFKSEGLGIVLFDRLEGDDPNTLMGLPLIRLVRMLENEQVFVL